MIEDGLQDCERFARRQLLGVAESGCRWLAEVVSLEMLFGVAWLHGDNHRTPHRDQALFR